MWVYSGRRGVHCWVCDESARQLPNDARGAVVDYLSLPLGGEGQDGGLKLQFPVHPSLTRAYDVLEPFFQECIIHEDGQKLLSSIEQWEPFLATLPDEDLAEKLRKKWAGKSDHSTPVEKWAELKSAVTPKVATAAMKKQRISDRYAKETWKYVKEPRA